MIRSCQLKLFIYMLCLFQTFVCFDAYAQSSMSPVTNQPKAEHYGLGKMAHNIRSHYKSIGVLLLGTAYIAGICFVIAALFKFKQHKDNPTQITIGTPFTLLLIGVFMIFLPGWIKPVGQSVFGHDVHSTNSYGGKSITQNLFDDDQSDLLW